MKISFIKKKIILWLTFLSGVTITHAGDWPGWRGEGRTGVSKETGLLQQWPENGPKRMWLSKEAGLGYSGFSVVGNQLFTMAFYDGRLRPEGKIAGLERLNGEKALGGGSRLFADE